MVAFYLLKACDQFIGGRGSSEEAGRAPKGWNERLKQGLGSGGGSSVRSTSGGGAPPLHGG